LGANPDVGDLTYYRKVAFDEKRYRIVYRLLPNESQPTIIQVIAIGPRAELEVYKTAVARLEELEAAKSAGAGRDAE
jgi:hypothetical protein